MTEPRTGVHAVYNWLPVTQPWIHNQLAYLPDRVTSHVVCRHTENLDRWDFPRVHQVPRWRWLLDKGLHRAGLRDRLGYMASWIDRTDADLLHSHFGDTAWSNHRTAEALGIPHVATVYGFDVSRLPRDDPAWRDRYEDLWGQVDLVLGEGPHMVRQVQDLGCPKGKTRVHHLGIEVDEIPFRPRTRDRDEPLRVFMAASFKRKKGFPDALEALGRLREEHGVDVEATVVGDATDDPRSRAEKERILETVDAWDLGEAVTFPGYVDHDRLLELAYDHHLFLQPSKHGEDGDNEGGAPVAVIEMAATGMPVVATTHCDIPEVIDAPEGGRLVPEGDVDALVGALARLAGDAAAWEGMARHARDRVEAEFDAATQGERLAGHYDDVVDGR